MAMNPQEQAAKIGSVIGKMKIDEAIEGGVHHWDLWTDAKEMIEALNWMGEAWIETAIESARDAFMEYERQADYQDQCMWASRFAAFLNARPETDNPRRLIARTDYDHGRRVVRIGEIMWTIHVESTGRVFAKGPDRMFDIGDLTLGGTGTVVEML